LSRELLKPQAWMMDTADMLETPPVVYRLDRKTDMALPAKENYLHLVC